MPAATSTYHLRRWLVRLLKLAIVGLLLWGVQHSLASGLRDLGETARQIQPAWLVVSGLIYLASIVPAALFWHRLLLAYGQQVSCWHAVRAYIIGHLGKYVPGKAMVVVLRAGLVRNEHVSTPVAAAAVFVETLTLMAVGSFWAAVILAIWFREHWVYAVLGLLVMIGIVLPTLPPVARLTLGYARRRFRWPLLDKLEQLEQLDLRTLVWGWVALSIGWLLAGLSLWAAVRSLGIQTPGAIDGLPFYTASVAVSVVAGFLSFIPAGAVVRDVLLAELLTSQLSEAVALAAAILLRLVWLIAEALAAGVLFLIRSKAVPGSVAAELSGEPVDSPG